MFPFDDIIMLTIRLLGLSDSGKPVAQPMLTYHQFDGLVQERRNSSVLAMELCPSYINPLR